MKSIEETQRFKQDKCSLLLQTAECCDINEIIQQLKTHNAKTKPDTKLLIERNALIKKFYQNYGQQTTTTKSTTLSKDTTAQSVGYKYYPKYVQNIDSIGFEKPNWKPLMLNEKADYQFNNLSITNSLTSFQSAKTVQKPTRTNDKTPSSHKLDLILNSDSHKQRLFELNRKKKRDTSFDSSSATDFDDQMKNQRHKKLLLGASNLMLKSVKLIPRKPSLEQQQSSENFNNNENNEKPVNFPPLRKASIQSEQFLCEGSSSFFNLNLTKSNYDTEKIRDLSNSISISKISPLSKSRSVESEKLYKSENFVFDHEKSQYNFDDEPPSPTATTTQNEPNFFNDLIKQKNDLDAYIAQLKYNNEKTLVQHAPPNSPIPYEQKAEEIESILVTIPDRKKFPPSNVNNKPIINGRRRKIQAFTDISALQILTNHETNVPLIKPSRSKSKVNLNNNKKDNLLEKNLQRKIGEGSINMIKINNKNVRILSNMSQQNNFDSSSSYDRSKNNLPIGPSINEKLSIDIYIPNLS
jgi:hypothetical protein